MTVPTRPGRHTGVVIAVVVALVLAAVATVSIVRWFGDDGPTTATGPSSSATPRSSSPSPPTSATIPAPSRSTMPTGPISPPAKATPTKGRPGWVALRTPDGWSYQVPQGDGWTSAQDVMAYVDRRGKVLVEATQPSYLRAGACKNPASVARGVVGWATPAAGKNAAEVAMKWATALAVHDDGSHDPVSRVATRPVPNPSMEIEHSVVMVTSERSTGCLPRATQISATSYRGEGGTRILVVVRDIGVEGAMSGATKEQIVRGVRHTPR